MTGQYVWVDGIVSSLAEIHLPNVFNPYNDVCPVHDRIDAPSVRRQNLWTYIASAHAQGADSIWFGRDLGYRGGRRTGLPLTDEANLATLNCIFSSARVRKATKSQLVAERTAAEIWGVIAQLPRPPLLWNAFPLHPHEPGKPMTNRCHKAAEASVTRNLLVELL